MKKPTFEPDWDLLEATQEALKEQMQLVNKLQAENEKLKKHIREMKE